MRRRGRYTKKSTIRGARLETNKYIIWFKNLKLWQKIAIIIGPIVAVMVIIPLLTYIYFARDIANEERLMNRNNTGVVLTDINDDIIYQVGRAKHREVVPLDQISDWTEKALIASEDKNFYEHGGFSVVSIVGAMYGNIVTGGTNYGGSTLTQQLAKNTLLSNQKTFLRKFQELSVSIAIERTYEKDKILEMYLNSVYYGENTFGIEDAAKVYFNKSPADLDIAQSALLIGLLPAPSAYSPISGDAELAKKRQATVLSRMVDNGMITQAQKDEALKQKLEYAKTVSAAQKSPAPHFAEIVIDDLKEKYGEEKALRSGFQVKTTLDLSLQNKLQQNISNNMTTIQANGGSNAAGVAIDPKTGEVRALVGSYDYDDDNFGKVNMATSLRQPGSSFKPIYYSEALASGKITPATILKDEATDFGGYTPQNALRNFNGDVSVRKALNYSLNIPAVKVMEKVGVNETVDLARRMGLESIDKNKGYGLSLALGSAEVKLIDMVHAYSAFAHRGEQKSRRTIQSIKDKFDTEIYTAVGTTKRVLSEGGAYLVSDILSDNASRSGMFGASLNVAGHRVAVKTGTTDDSKDAWTIGYTPDIAIGVWVGNNDNEPMLNGGAVMAGPIWVNTMQYALEGLPYDTFKRPDSIVERSVCNGTGRLARSEGEGTYREVFIATSLPEYGCDPFAEKKKKEQEEKKREEAKRKAEEEAEREKERLEEEEAEQETQDDEQNSNEESDGSDSQDGSTNNGTGGDDNPQGSNGGGVSTP